MAKRTADVFVIFGITGDLAKVMTFRSLYRLERQGLLHCPIIGVAVDDWTTPELRRHMRASIEAREGALDSKVFNRLAGRVSYVCGDFGDPETFSKLGRAIGKARVPVFYLETPPSLFATVVKGLAGAGLTENARVVIEKPFGHDLRSARALAAELHGSIREEQILRIDHFLGKLGLAELVYVRFANTVLGHSWNRESISSIQITMAEWFGVEDRGRFYDSVGALRDVVVNHLLQVVAMVALEEGGEGEPLDEARQRLLRSVVDADPRRCVRGQYAGYRTTAGVRRGSTTETYIALELWIENERWSGVPFYIRTGKHLPVTQTEVRVIFKQAPPLTFLARHNQPQANELVVRIDPKPGIRMILEAHRADADGPEPVTLDMDFADQGGEGPTPYEVLFEAALNGDRTLFVPQGTVDEAWRIVEPLLALEGAPLPYRRGSWGPAAAKGLLDAGEHWRQPWQDVGGEGAH